MSQALSLAEMQWRRAADAHDHACIERGERAHDALDALMRAAGANPLNDVDPTVRELVTQWLEAAAAASGAYSKRWHAFHAYKEAMAANTENMAAL